MKNKTKQKKNELIYPFQFGFKQKHSTAHALIYLTEKNMVVMVAIFFIDFQKTLDTKDLEN